MEENGEVSEFVKYSAPEDFQNSILESQNEYTENQETVSNKFYDYMKRVNRDLTPFEDINTETLQFSHGTHVQSTIHMLIDNIVEDYEHFYSHVVKRTESQLQRFVIQRYNLGLNKQVVSKLNSYGMTSETHENTPSDKAYQQSVVFLPNQLRSNVYKFNKSNSIYDKTMRNENNLNYWALLRKSTSVVTHEVTKETNVNELYDFTNIQHFIAKEGFETYKQFLQHVLPTTRYLLENVTKLEGMDQTTYDSILKSLEPYGITKDDIIFKDHKRIMSIIEHTIQKIKVSLVEQKMNYKNLKKIKIENVNGNVLDKFYRDSGLSNVNAIEGTSMNMSEAQRMYSIETVKQDPFDESYSNTISETLARAQVIDHNQLLYRLLSYDTRMLYTDVNVEEMIEELIESKEKAIKDDKKGDGSCSLRRLVAEYYSLDELEATNNEVATYSKKYDNTNYMIIEEYKSEQESMTEVDFIDFPLRNFKKTLD